MLTHPSSTQSTPGTSLHLLTPHMQLIYATTAPKPALPTSMLEVPWSISNSIHYFHQLNGSQISCCCIRCQSCQNALYSMSCNLVSQHQLFFMLTMPLPSRWSTLANPLNIPVIAIDIQHFAIQEWHQQGHISLSHIPGVSNPSDDLTKALGWVLHHRHARRVMGHHGIPSSFLSIPPSTSTGPAGEGVTI